MSAKVYTIEELKIKIGKVLADFPVQKAILFGSYAKGEADSKSDIDLVVDTNNQLRGLAFFGLRAELREKLKKDFDLIDKKSIIKGGRADKEIKKSGVVIYET